MEVVVIEVACLMEGQRENGGRMAMLRITSLEWREKGHVRGSEVVSLMEGE